MSAKTSARLGREGCYSYEAAYWTVAVVAGAGHEVISSLVVDDDPQVVRVLRITLAARGYTALTASEGRAALRGATECQPRA